MAGDNHPDEEELSSDDEFRDYFGEDLPTTLDLDTWVSGFDLEEMTKRLREEISSAVDRESRLRAIIRQEVLPRLERAPGRPAQAGVHPTRPEELADIADALLFPGRVEAVMGNSSSHESLPIGITQIGIAVVGYGGTSGTFSQRLFRKEVASQSADPVKEAMEYIAMRQNRFGPGRKDMLSKLARRGIRTYAERAVLVDKLKAEWRIGHGNPFAYELLSGSGYMGLLKASLGMLRRLMQHKQFVFTPSTLEERGFLTIGYALHPGEFAILDTLERYGRQIVAGWKYGDSSKQLAREFVRDYCPQILIGVFRVSDRSPPRLFYAHRDTYDVGVRVAMADSMLRPERGFPMLLDVADAACRSAFGTDGFLGLVQDAYAQAGANLQYFSERETRR